MTTNVRANYSRTFGHHEITFGGNADSYTTIADNLNVEGHGLYGTMHSASSVDNSLTGTGRSLIGAIGYVTQQTKQRWYADDMNTLEYVVAKLKERR